MDGFRDSIMAPGRLTRHAVSVHRAHHPDYDSIRVNGRLIGIDKINHFIREGRRIEGGGRAGRQHRGCHAERTRFAWCQFRNEYGLKGWSLTGVLAYSDLAASYSGYKFWSDLSSIGQPGSLVKRDATSGRFVPRRPFTFADYVNDAWDEGVNCSEFQPGLAKQVASALAKRTMTCPAAGASSLSGLPDGRLYVNPKQWNAGTR